MFERGAFTRSDTVNSMFVLSMFMIGLLPFGLAKIFSLWLYAKNKQNIAAKIAIKSLILNIISCFLLIKPLGAAGLALASSIGGFYLFIMNLKEFGFGNFLDIINPKKIFIILALCSIEVLLLLVFKEIINDYI